MLARMERPGDNGGGSRRSQEDATVVRLRPLRVLVLSADHRFRAVMAMLLARRGCAAFSASAPGDVAETLLRERVDVMLVDGADLLGRVGEGVSHRDAAALPVGVVLVGEEAGPRAGGLLALAKWGAFGELFAAIVTADRARLRPSPPRSERALGEIRARRLS
jgi:hypothetical protein